MAPKAKDIVPEKDGSWIGKYPEKDNRCLKKHKPTQFFYIFLMINCVFQNVYKIFFSYIISSDPLKISKNKLR